MFLACNKTDVMTLERLATEQPAKRAAIQRFEDKGVSVFQLSTWTKDGVQELKNAACEKLLNFRWAATTTPTNPLLLILSFLLVLLLRICLLLILSFLLVLLLRIYILLILILFPPLILLLLFYLFHFFLFFNLSTWFSFTFATLFIFLLIFQLFTILVLILVKPW